MIYYSIMYVLIWSDGLRQVYLYTIRASWDEEGTCTVHVPKHGESSHCSWNHVSVCSVHGGAFFSKGARSVPDELGWRSMGEDWLRSEMLLSDCWQLEGETSNGSRKSGGTTCLTLLVWHRFSSKKHRAPAPSPSRRLRFRRARTPSPKTATNVHLSLVCSIQRIVTFQWNCPVDFQWHVPMEFHFCNFWRVIFRPDH